MSTTDAEKLGHPFAGMTDADGNAIPGNGETDEEGLPVSPPHDEGEKEEETTEGLHAVADDIEKLQAAAESLPAEPPRLDGEDGEGEPTSAGGENLFNPRAYDDPALQLPMVDGQGIDKIALKFSGTIRLDRSKPEDVELFKRMKLGRDIEVKLEGKVVGANTTGATNKDGDLDVVVGTKTLDVHTIYPLSIED